MKKLMQFIRKNALPPIQLKKGDVIRGRNKDVKKTVCKEGRGGGGVENFFFLPLLKFVKDDNLVRSSIYHLRRLPSTSPPNLTQRDYDPCSSVPLPSP